MKVEPGIYPGVPFSEYQHWDAVNNSLLWVLRTQSPLHAHYYQENPKEPTEVFKTGNALHTLILEPKKFDERYAVAPKCDKRTKVGKETWQKFAESLNGKEFITRDIYKDLEFVANAIRKQIIHRFIRNGEAEVCIVWVDEQTGLLCKGRVDYVHREQAILIDIKSTIDGSPRAFTRWLYNFGYYQECGFYCDGWRTLTKDDPAFVFLPAEKQPPYAVAAYEMHEQVIDAGRKSYRQALKVYAECQKSNTWPGYADTVEMLNLPEWALRKEGVNKYEVIP